MPKTYTPSTCYVLAGPAAGLYSPIVVVPERLQPRKKNVAIPASWIEENGYLVDKPETTPTSSSDSANTPARNTTTSLPVTTTETTKTKPSSTKALIKSRISSLLHRKPGEPALPPAKDIDNDSLASSKY